MKLITSTTLLFLLAVVPAYAQQDQDKDKDKDKPRQEEPKKQPEKEKPPQGKPSQEGDRQQQEREKEQAKDKGKENEKQAKDAQKQEKQQVEHQNVDRSRQTQRDGGDTHARRIREEDFHSHFGREHHFRVARRDDRRFQYGGYWFEYTQPWPVGWSYDDDVYVDEADGEYYLIDPVHPGIRLLIIVAG